MIGKTQHELHSIPFDQWDRMQPTQLRLEGYTSGQNEREKRVRVKYASCVLGPNSTSSASGNTETTEKHFADSLLPSVQQGMYLTPCLAPNGW